uniref:Uncharacterized protein n=1 Tax=Anguilla anguilla TaxID=7936 RepID=A0A0E9QP32_ANGAN
MEANHGTLCYNASDERDRVRGREKKVNLISIQDFIFQQ